MYFYVYAPETNQKLDVIACNIRHRALRAGVTVPLECLPGGVCRFLWKEGSNPGGVSGVHCGGGQPRASPGEIGLYREAFPGSWRDLFFYPRVTVFYPA